MYRYVIKKYNRFKHKWEEFLIYDDCDKAFETYKKLINNNKYNSYLIQQSLDLRCN